MNKLKSIFLVSCIIIMSCKSQNLEDGLYADIETNKGSILLSLTYEDVPITVANFVSLAEGTNDFVSENFKDKKFYDGLTFHRVLKDFMVQGGDPLANGSGNPGYKFDDEYPMSADSSGFKLRHDRAGILSMANSGAGTNTNGSQFFITHKATPWLDGIHSVFGHVVTGQNVVDSIAQRDTIIKIKILRVGSKAKKFNAATIFNGYFADLEEKARVELERAAKIKADFLTETEKYKSAAEELSSGLKIHFLNKGNGVKPKEGSKVKVYYAGYFTDGNLFDSNIREVAKSNNQYNGQRDAQKGYEAVAMDYDPASTSMIPAFKEALSKMSTGDKVMIFIPSHLAWGAQGRGPIPPNTDVMFQLEIVE